LKILIASTEMFPFAKVGGLAEATSSLARALSARGHEVAVVLPKYLTVDRRGFSTEPIDVPLLFRIDDEERTGWIHQARLPDTEVTAYFVVNDHYFNRNGLYQEEGKDFPDNLARFTFFCRGTMELLRSGEFVPDIIHCQNWQTALIPAYLKTDSEYEGFRENVKTVFSVHNIAYQGFFPKDQFAVTGLSWDLFSPEGIEYYGDLNLLKAGLVFSDHITTSSERYAAEIMTPDYGCGMESVVQAHRHRLTGILNGVDYDVWNPATDDLLPARYRPDDLSGKETCRNRLLDCLGLPKRPETPLVSTICASSNHKDLELIPGALEVLLLAEEIQLAVLESGSTDCARVFHDLRKRFPTGVGVCRSTDDVHLHLMQAGADLILVPGRPEPSGLTHLVALKYGTAPIVRQSGAIAEAVRDYNEAQRDGFGFVFHNPEARDLLQALRRALSLYRDKTAWIALQRRGMACDFSWNESARKYENLYRQLLEAPL